MPPNIPRRCLPEARPIRFAAFVVTAAHRAHPGSTDQRHAIAAEQWQALRRRSLPSGAPSTLAAPGLGVEWVDHGSYYQLLSDHGVTADGITRMPVTTLVAMARTVR